MEPAVQRLGAQARSQAVERGEQALLSLSVEPRHPAHVAAEVLLGDLSEPALLAHTGTSPQHVDRSLFRLDRLEQTIQIAEVARISLHAGHVPADQLNSRVQRVLVSASDEDVSSFVDEQLGTSQRHTACRACDHA